MGSVFVHFGYAIRDGGLVFVRELLIGKYPRITYWTYHILFDFDGSKIT